MKNEIIDLLKEKITKKYFSEFIDLINENKFFDNLSNDDLEDFKEYLNEKEICFSSPFLNQYKIKIQIELYENECFVGIDPTYCFNKLKHCNTIIHFPLSKREFERFKTHFIKILDKKTDYSKDWFENSNYYVGNNKSIFESSLKE
jgi:hypothetical protein